MNNIHNNNNLNPQNNVSPTALPQCNPSSFATAIMDINWNDYKQKIDGFGVSQASYSHVIYLLPEPTRSEIMDLLFTQNKGVGFSILRGEVFPTFNPEAGIYNFDSRPDQNWILKEAQNRKVDKLILTAWTPPAWMKSNNSTIRGFLNTENYTDFAKLLSKTISAYKQNHGIDLFGISPANEPTTALFANWASCSWNGSQLSDFIANHLKQGMIDESVSEKKVYLGENTNWSEAIAIPSLEDSESEPRVDIVASHAYTATGMSNGDEPPFTVARNQGKSVWMTEVCDDKIWPPDYSIDDGIKFAKQIHNFLTIPEINAYLFWVGCIYAGNNEGLIFAEVEKDSEGNSIINPDAPYAGDNAYIYTGTYTTAKRLYTIGQFSKFIRPGYHRINVDNFPLAGISLSAYRGETMYEFAIVAVNETTEEITVGIPSTNIIPSVLSSYVTDQNLNLEKVAEFGKQFDGNFYVTLPPRSVVTVVPST